MVQVMFYYKDSAESITHTIIDVYSFSLMFLILNLLVNDNADRNKGNVHWAIQKMKP